MDLEPITFYETASRLEKEGSAFVVVSLVEATGSVPQDAGAKMLVSKGGILKGTVGGGRVEAAALKLAQEMLMGGSEHKCLVNWSLKADLGMTCGGSVRLFFECHAAGGAAWPLVVFGAGHISQALIPVLLPLECSVTVCDPQEWIDRLPAGRNLRVRRMDHPADLIPTLPDHAFLIVMTQGHQTDRPILYKALLERSFPFIGVIGSDAKAAVLRKELIAEGLSPEKASLFHCPVGLPFGSNHPHEIALSIAGQLLAERGRLAKR